MVRSVVEAVEDDKAFWYGECRLPATYQTFFQLHLLYILILLPRLRVLPASEGIPPHSIPEPVSVSPPQNAETPSSSTSILTKPDYEVYVTELLNHFFEMAESQMRVVLGKGERERVVRKYMDEMGTQWKGAGVGLDYVMGLSMSEVAEERAKADEELASWVWRNTFQGKGLGKDTGIEDAGLADQLEQVVRFIRKEQTRLDRINDADVIAGNIGRWGLVREE
jgi:cytochrome b pre-mRNA-processing protein 3